MPDLRVGIGFSDELKPSAAARCALEQAINCTRRPDLIFILTTENYDPEVVLSSVVNTVGTCSLVGAWTPGIIINFEVHARGIGVCSISGEGVEAVTHLEKGAAGSSFSRGERMGKILLEKAGDRPGTVFLFSDAFCSNISELLRGLYNVMGPGFNYAGGGCGNNLQFSSTYQFTEQRVGRKAVAAALLRGINFKIELDHGWSPVGEPLTITKAEGRRVYEIDGIPAFKRYRDLVWNCTRNGFPCCGMQYPFGLPAAGGNFIIRDPLKAEEDESILFVTEVPENAIATIMEGDADSIVAAARKVAKNALNAHRLFPRFLSCLTVFPAICCWAKTFQGKWRLWPGRSILGSRFLGCFPLEK